MEFKLRLSLCKYCGLELILKLQSKVDNKLVKHYPVMSRGYEAVIVVFHMSDYSEDRPQLNLTKGRSGKLKIETC